ncbi:MAG: hypothetical protein CME34_03135 [Gordonia sp.]|uniref:hypothetical protein n=1 Tax=Gordonia sp. (in: high G+C Gram-positive bacteria) TaxID=84139 RepID=UPI000C67FEAD|nr:hypothetical protein [Gordonia sp. (in: high G+C Gram-positive bacteria)]MAU80864.1 hypothetical protein [Gordonia sp. (in: high G+C Gram-positive bacteria)]
MSEHEQESRELEQHMERALAVAIAHSSSLIQSWAQLAAKRAARRAQQGQDLGAMPAPDTAEHIAASAHAVQQRARGDLAVGRGDANFWRQASPEELLDKIRTDYRIDPARLGARDHDRGWAERAKGDEVVGLLAVAGRYADDSAVAAGVRDNLAGLIAEYGLDPDELMGMSPQQAAECYVQSRAEYWAPQQPPTMTSDGRDAIDREGAQVAALLSGAQAADERAALAADMSDSAAAQADTISTEPSTRAQRVAASSHTSAGKAAATAARDHPTNPRMATTSTGAKQPTARRSNTLSADRERGRGL